MKTIYIYKPIIFTLVGLLSILFSCEKTKENNLVGGEARLSVNIELAYEAENDILASTNSLNKETGINTHIQHVNEDFYLESQLIPVEDVRSKAAIKGLKQSATVPPVPLGNNIKYKLLVYDANENLVDSQDYTYNSETLETSIVLNSYTKYIFVVVSARSTTDLPEIENMSKLSEAIVKNVNADLLYWISDLGPLKEGQNFLKAKLKPKFSEVTTTLQMHNTMTGLITSISNPKFHSLANNISLKLSDGTVEYGSINTISKDITFPSLGNGVKTTTAPAITLIHDPTNTASLNFGTLRVDGESKHNITVAGLNFKPGHRYNLILTLNTCTEAVKGVDQFNWHYKEDYKGKKTGIYKGDKFVQNGDTIMFSFNEKGADYGFVYDIFELDNAFNMLINNKAIFGEDDLSSDIQFQNNATKAYQNIEFADGQQYQSDDVDPIWTIIDTATNRPQKPIIRVVISRHGVVEMYGAKKGGEDLKPLRLKHNRRFNTVTWNGGDAGENKIVATTRIEGKTVMKASGSGRKKIRCP